MVPEAGAANERRSAPDFVTRSWRVADGLPHDTVLSVTQTREGYLWIGTLNGLARFDGMEFRRFGVADGLPGLSVWVLLEDRAGALWVGTDNGLSRYHEGRFTSWTVRDGLAGSYISALAEDGEGVLWIGTNSGLNRWRQGRLERDAMLASRTVGGLVPGEQGGMLVSVSGLGLLRWDGQSYAPVPQHPGPSPFHPVRLYRDQAGRIWAGGSGLHCLQDNAWTAFGGEVGLPTVGITSLSESADGRLWVGTRDEGLFFLRHGRFHRVTPEDGLTDTAIFATCQDSEKNLWVGTRTEGLCRLRSRRVFVWRHFDGDTEVAPRSLAETPDGALWVAAYARGLYRIDPEQPGHFVRQSLPSLPAVLLSDPFVTTGDGSLWLGLGPLLKQWRQGELVAEHQLPAELQGERARCLREDREGGLWIGTLSGRALLLRGDKFTVFFEGLPRAMATALVQQANGTIWIGSFGDGLGRLKDGVGARIGKEEGLSSDLVRALLLDSHDRLWIGTEGGGLNCLRDGQVRVIGPNEGLEAETVVQVLEDDTGDLWLGTYQGIFRIAGRELEDLLAGRRTRVHPRRFDRADGMVSAQCNTGPNGALKTRDGRLLFCTYQGLVHIDPRQMMEVSPPPVVRLEAFFVEGQVRPHASGDGGGGALTIQPGQQRFEFRFTALRSIDPERVRFRCRLAGLESEWTELQARRSAHYGYLPPGHYRFEVTAHGGDGVWREKGASLAFTVLPHFWETWWFRVGSWLGGAAAVAGLVGLQLRRRHRRRLQALEYQRAVDRERARIAQDMHDELGSRLTKAGMIAEIAARDREASPAAQDRLQALRRTLDDMTITMDELVWAVNPQHDTLDGLANYLLRYTQEFFAGTNVRCEFSIPPDLPAAPLGATVRHNLFLAYKEGLTNAAKHAHPSVIAVRVEFAANRLRLEVEDDGPGFDPAAEHAGGRGLENMRDRLRAIGGQCEVASRAGRGTRVSFILTLPPTPHVYGNVPPAPNMVP
jgi:signal transduction histidine kinase/ligand-binding sensor domain-containing protein